MKIQNDYSISWNNAFCQFKFFIIFITCICIIYFYNLSLSLIGLCQVKFIDIFVTMMFNHCLTGLCIYSIDFILLELSFLHIVERACIFTLWSFQHTFITLYFVYFYLNMLISSKELIMKEETIHSVRLEASEVEPAGCIFWPDWFNWIEHILWSISLLVGSLQLLNDLSATTVEH